MTAVLDKNWNGWPKVTPEWKHEKEYVKVHGELLKDIAATAGELARDNVTQLDWFVHMLTQVMCDAVALAKEMHGSDDK